MSAVPIKALFDEDAVSIDISFFIDSLMEDYGFTRREAMAQILNFIKEDEDTPMLGAAFMDAALRRIKGGPQ